MSFATPIPLPATPALRLRAALRRAPRVLWIVLAILLSWGAEYAVYSAFEPHGTALRHELQGAAAVLQTQLTLQPTPVLRQEIREHFPEGDAEIDTQHLWPIVAVSLHGLSRGDCLDALHHARRVNGAVVIALQGYGSAVDCRDQNDMTWWLMP
jgi:hypothetical protein